MRDIRKENIRFFANFARHYDRGIMKFLQSGIISRILGKVNIKNNSRILDAGCGTGTLLHALSKQNSSLKLEGIDISREMLEIARKKLSKSIKLRLQEVEKLKEQRKFDYIFSIEAFHHYENKEKAMKKFYNALRKNGKLVVVDLDFGVLNKIFEKIEPGNSGMSSKENFKNLFKLNNFKIIEQKNLGLFAIMTVGERKKEII